ncbi:ERF family protein [Solibacillus sp. MA9]|uniref:ERF family protein n=1 Tax=Solibacillus palustris TaxID=2908203 RepID=A0ABS9UBN2_9BACL|nr:ERF family protein [Solibacillus sp. MA9]MCH7321753.1 ERF family protein [Solibacillus sp. MA9]
MNKSESIIELAKALATFQGEVKQPTKDGKNPHFKSTYVTLDGVVQAITETASKHGLSFMQFPINDEARIGIKTLVMHISGEFIETDPIFATPGKQDAQAAGSVITYLKRYSLAAIFGITSDVDDDGEGASFSSNQQYQQPQYQNQQYQLPQYQQQNQTAPPQQSNGITEPQLKALNAKLSNCAGGDKDQMAVIYNGALDVMGIPSGTNRKDLTKTQASKVIDYLANLEPATA